MNHRLPFARNALPSRLFRALGRLLPALCIVALSACAPAAPAASTPRPTAAVSTDAAPTPAPVTPAAEAGPITLIWWTPEFLSPDAPQPAGAELSRQLGAFTMEEGGEVRVQALRKARYGKGGLLDALRAAAPVAPASLPDIIALDVAELEGAVNTGALQPLDALFDPAVTESLYAFATESGKFGDKVYALQYLADIEHAAFLPQQVAEAPTTWTEVVERRVAYLFALGAPKGGGAARPAEGLSHAALGQYLSAGATLGADRRLLLEAQPLLKLLTFYGDATKAGVLPPAALELEDGEAVWSVFSQGQAPLASISGRKYATERSATNAGHAFSPGLSGPATPVSSGWALAIVARDARRQAAAARLIAFLLRADNAGRWARAGGWLPTSSGALQAVGTGEYGAFLDAQLAAARSIPVGPEYADTAERIQAAITAVVTGKSDPAAATEAAVDGRQ